MANYSTIKGWTIPTLSSDPSNPIEGQIWYNSTSNDIKCQSYVLGSGVWSSGGGMVNARLDCGAAGVQDAGLAIGGQTTPTDNYTEKYDGTSWTEVNNMNTGRGQAELKLQRYVAEELQLTHQEILLKNLMEQVGL